MITFTLSFLVAFPLTTKTMKILNEKRTEKTSEKKNKLKLDEEDSLIITGIELNASNITNCAHITYELVPNKCKYDIEILCWGPVARILTTDGQYNIYTIINNDLIWVPVIVEHYMEHLSLPDLKSFRDKVIEFFIYNNIIRAPVILKNDKIFIEDTKIIENEEFIKKSSFYIFSDESRKPTPKSSLDPHVNKPSIKNTSKSDCASWLSTDNKFDKFYDIIENISKGEQIKTNEFIPPVEHMRKEDDQGGPHTSRSKGTLLKKEKSINYMKTKSGYVNEKKGKKDEDENNLCVKVPAEILFTKPLMSLYHKKNPGEFIRNFFILLSVDKLLSRAQKLELNPLVINIIKINNFPVDELIEQGFHSVFASYIIPQVLSCKTQIKQIEKNIYFNEPRMHFTDDVPKIKVVEALQTQKFFVEFYGYRYAKHVHQHQCNFFGKNPEDFNVSKIRPSFEYHDFSTQNDKPVLIAVNLFDLSSLVDNIWDFKERGQCHEPYLTLTTKPAHDQIKSLSTTVNEINLEAKKVECVIPECTFLELGTTLTLEAYLMAPQAASLDYHHAPNTFKRIIIIADDEDFATVITNNIVSNNGGILEMIHNTKNVQSEDLEQYDILTGFALDNGSSHFFYIEGPSTGFILNMWHIIEGHCPNSKRDDIYDDYYDDDDDNEEEVFSFKKAKIFFNTDNAFEKRLYMNFITIGVYQIVLKLPLQNILSNPLLYSRKHVPKPCMEALKKLCLLFHSTSYKDILQQNLLPSAHELISLNLEWGVPNRWKNKYYM